MKLQRPLVILTLCALVACGGSPSTPIASVPTAAPAAATAATDAPAAATATAATDATAATAATADAPADATDAPTTATDAATDTPAAAPTEVPAAANITGSAAAAVSNTDGYFRLQTQLTEGDNKCLEGQGGAAPGSGAVLNGAAFMDRCQNVTGQIWKLIPQKNGYYHVQNQLSEAQNLCLEGNRLAQESLLAGAAVMNACQDVTGQAWKLVDAGNGYYHLQTQFLEGENKCLEGQAGAAPGSGAVLDGAAFMDDCKNASGQLWKILPTDVAVLSATTAAPEATAMPQAPVAPQATAAPEATAMPEATVAAVATAMPTASCASQYADEIAKFKDAVIADFASERDEATQKDGIARAPVKWNDQMACQAQEWAQALATGTYQSNPHCCYRPIPVHSDLGSWKVGNAEGIAGGKTAIEGIQLWRTLEMPNYNFSASEAAKQKDHTCSRPICGHYGAVIGLFTLEVGCGFYPPQAGKEQNYNVVCQYIFKDPR